MHESASESLRSKLKKSHSLRCGCPKKKKKKTGIQQVRGFKAIGEQSLASDCAKVT